MKPEVVKIIKSKINSSDFEKGKNYNKNYIDLYDSYASGGNERFHFFVDSESSIYYHYSVRIFI